MKTVAVTGFKGKLGRLLCGRSNFVGMDCDITDSISIDSSLETLQRSGVYPNIIVNCAAISSIDKCEEDEKRATLVNVRGLYNLHTLFGSKVLNISSDHVFASRKPVSEHPINLNDENVIENIPIEFIPVNQYGWSKFGAEQISKFDGGKTIRLSRSVSIEDVDLSYYLMELYAGREILVPTFFSRNYLHREYVVNGIEYFVSHWDKMPQIVNYGAMKSVRFYDFLILLAKKFKLNSKLVIPREDYYTYMPARPRGGGLKVGLAKKLGFPMYSISDTCVRLAKDAHAL